jgi:hypothetical protein
MADEWVGVRAQLPSDPKTIAVTKWLARHEPFRDWLGVTPESLPRNALVGVTLAGFVRIWAVGNSRGVLDDDDALLVHCDFEAIDEIAGVPGISLAMETVHWVARDQVEGISAVRLPNFREYNKPSEERTDREKERRAKNRERQKRFRERHALPNATVTPRNAPTEQNITEHNNQPANQPPNPLPDDRLAGRLAGVSWDEVMRRLGAVGVANAPQTLREARDGCSCTPEWAMRLLDYAQANGMGPGAIVWRFKRAVPSLPVEHGWPVPGDLSADTVARNDRLAKKKLLESADLEATDMIKKLRRQKKTEDEIRAELTSKGLEWPK